MRWRLKSVNAEPSTVADADVSWIMTAAAKVPKTHFTLNNPISHGRMGSIKPAWRLCTTMIHVDTRLSHLTSSFSTESVPARYLVIAEKGNTSVVICSCTVGLVQECVTETCYKGWQWNGLLLSTTSGHGYVRDQNGSISPGVRSQMTPKCGKNKAPKNRGQRISNAPTTFCHLLWFLTRQTRRNWTLFVLYTITKNLLKWALR